MNDLPPIEPDPEFVANIRLPALLQALRDQTGLSQQDAARLSYEKFGFRLAQPMLSAWENGDKVPTEASLWHVALTYAQRIEGADPAQIFAHLKEARDHKSVPQKYDYDILVLADRLQAHPHGERGRLARALLNILKEIEHLGRISPGSGDKSAPGGPAGDNPA